jgi:hypothetical protein
MTTGTADTQPNPNEYKSYVFGIPLVDLPRYQRAPDIGKKHIEHASFVNFPLLDEIMTYIENHPMEWRQDDWFKIVDLQTGVVRYDHEETIVTEINSCGASMCFAGHVALRMGFPAPPKSNSDAWTRDVLDPKDNYEYTESVSEFAERVLGLRWHQAEALFDGDNTLQDLQDIVQALHIDPSLEGVVLEEVSERDRDEYPSVRGYLIAENYIDA